MSSVPGDQRHNIHARCAAALEKQRTLTLGAFEGWPAKLPAWTPVTVNGRGTSTCKFEAPLRSDPLLGSLEVRLYTADDVDALKGSMQRANESASRDDGYLALFSEDIVDDDDEDSRVLVKVSVPPGLRLGARLDIAQRHAIKLAIKTATRQLNEEIMRMSAVIQTLRAENGSLRLKGHGSGGSSGGSSTSDAQGAPPPARAAAARATKAQPPRVADPTAAAINLPPGGLSRDRVFCRKLMHFVRRHPHVVARRDDGRMLAYRRIFGTGAGFLPKPEWMIQKLRGEWRQLDFDYHLSNTAPYTFVLEICEPDAGGRRFVIVRSNSAIQSLVDSDVDAHANPYARAADREQERERGRRDQSAAVVSAPAVARSGVGARAGGGGGSGGTATDIVFCKEIIAFIRERGIPMIWHGSRIPSLRYSELFGGAGLVKPSWFPPFRKPHEHMIRTAPYNLWLGFTKADVHGQRNVYVVQGAAASSSASASARTASTTLSPRAGATSSSPLRSATAAVRSGSKYIDAVVACLQLQADGTMPLPSLFKAQGVGKPPASYQRGTYHNMSGSPKKLGQSSTDSQVMRNLLFASYWKIKVVHSRPFISLVSEGAPAAAASSLRAAAPTSPSSLLCDRICEFISSARHSIIRGNERGVKGSTIFGKDGLVKPPWAAPKSIMSMLRDDEPFKSKLRVVEQGHGVWFAMRRAGVPSGFASISSSEDKQKFIDEVCACVGYTADEGMPLSELWEKVSKHIFILIFKSLLLYSTFVTE